MGLTKKQYLHIKNELDSCQSPLYFFDDDPDGLSSFLLLYRYKREGHGIVVKTHPKLDSRSVSRLEEYKPDKVFILDIALLDQSFVDSCPVPIIWIDHHGPHEINGVMYFNPRIRKKYPDLVGNKKTIGDIYFTTRLGELIKAFSFCLKGKTADVRKSINVLTRIKTPYEILNQETPAEKFISKNFSCWSFLVKDLIRGFY